MQPINLRSFKQKAKRYKRSFSMFLTKLEKNPPKKLHQFMEEADKIVWAETDCLSCGNCCKTMTPTYNAKDIKRISTHLNMTAVEFKEKYLVFDKKDKDWQN